ncbi:MAG: phosphatase PAP2 family protein [Candidatus Neomarinimicrobiota bacterium]
MTDSTQKIPASGDESNYQIQINLWLKTALCTLLLLSRLFSLELPLPPPNPLSQPVEYLHYYPPHYLCGLQRTIGWRPNAPLLISGMILIPTAFLLDESIRDFAVEKGFFSDDISRIGDIYGHRLSYFAAAAVVGAHGMVRHQPWNKTFSQIELLATSAITTALMTETLKYVTHRERPNGKSYKSFPSGHTSGTFNLAAGLNEIFGRKVGIPAYLMATFVAASRINDDKHHFSDVVAGAILGIWIGRSFARQHHIEWQMSVGESPTLSLKIRL